MNSEDRIILKFQPKQNESNSDFTSLSNPNEKENIPIIVWNITEIQDFVRRLGFSDSGDENDNMKAFLQLFEVYLHVSFIEFIMFFLADSKQDSKFDGISL